MLHSDGIIQSGYLSIEVNTENHSQFEDQSVSMYVYLPIEASQPTGWCCDIFLL